MTLAIGDKGLDYAWSKPSPANIKSAGFKFVMRYLSWLPNGKVLTKQEALNLLANDIPIGLNWEFDAQDQLRGSAGGIKDAQEAVRQAIALGAPRGCVIYFSCDFDVQPAQMPTVMAYWSAAANICKASGYDFGVYGGKRAASQAINLGYHAWQTYAWSGGVWDARIHLKQYSNGHTVGGADCDYNELRSLSAGLWGQSAAQPPQPPVPPIPPPTRTALAIGFVDNSRLDAVGGIVKDIVETAAQYGWISSGLVSRLVMTSNLRGCTGVDYHEHCNDDKGAADIAAKTGQNVQGNKDMRDLAAFFYYFPGSLLELIHTTPYPYDSGFYVKNHSRVAASFYGDQVPLHLNHVHVAGSEGELSGLRTYIAAHPYTAPAYPLPTTHVYGPNNFAWQHNGYSNAGDKPAIILLQQRLQYRGFAPYTVGWADGLYGPQTTEAVKNFQREHGILINGQPYGTVDSPTWHTLFVPMGS